jgi:hypothetical protein
MFALGGCASALKQQCEKTNWFEHGKKLALAGKRVNDDKFVPECKREDVRVDEGQLNLGFQAGQEQYCEPEGAFRTGRNGGFLNTDMCGENELPLLREQHAAGVNQFCSAANGFTVGASGRKYNNICPAAVEAVFLPEYRRGRRAYLEQRIDGLETEVQLSQEKIFRLLDEKSSTESALAAVPASVTRKDLKGKDLAEQTKRNTQLDNQRNTLRRRISSLDSDLRSQTELQTRTRREIEALKLDLVAVSR